MKIVNPWYAPNNQCSRPEFTVDKPIYEKGDFKIFEQSYMCFLYTYKNHAFSQLAGINKLLIDQLINGHCIGEKNTFLFDRAMERIKVIDKIK